MATSPVKLQQGYGIGNALQNLAPFSIIANRVPSQQDKARIGTFWVYTGANNVYVLSSVTGGLSNWLTLSNGGAGVFTSLTVNGPSIFNGNVTQIAGVTSLLTTTITGNTLINAAGGPALSVTKNDADIVIYTQSSFLNMRHLLCRQISTDPSGVTFTTVKSQNGAVVLAGDKLFSHIVVATGILGESETARIQFTAGTPVFASSQVPSSMAISTTDTAGTLANRFNIDTDGNISLTSNVVTIVTPGTLRIIPPVSSPADTVTAAIINAYSGSVRFNQAAGWIAAPGALLPAPFIITNTALSPNAAVLVTIQIESATALNNMLRVAQVRVDTALDTMEIYVANDAAATGPSDATRCIVNFIVMTP